jgi:hypothetical protein
MCHSLFTDVSERNSVNTTVQFTAANLSNSLKQIQFLAYFPLFEEVKVGFRGDLVRRLWASSGQRVPAFCGT